MRRWPGNGSRRSGSARLEALGGSSVPCGRHCHPAWDGRPHQHRGGTANMTEPGNGRTGVKTLGIKLPDELHSQFTLVAQLDGLSLGDALRKAVELYVETKRGEGDFAARAAQQLEEMEREATARRDAIQALLGPATPADEGKTAGRRK